MKIDSTSELIFALIQKLINKNSSLVSEIWIEKEFQNKIENKYKDTSSNQIINLLEQRINDLNNKTRKTYLEKITGSIKFQLENNIEDIDLSMFYKKVFDYEIKEISDENIIKIINNLKGLEEKYNIRRKDVIKQMHLEKDEIMPFFEKEIKKVKECIPSFLLIDDCLEYSIVKDKPWSAFNQHIKPYTSRLSLNINGDLNTFDIKHICMHEGYGGHHTELSLKDRMLVDKGKLEHGFILVYSPQTFISEGIAEMAFEIFRASQDLKHEEKVYFAYSKLFYALLNKATFLHYKHKKSREEIKTYLFEHGIIQEGIKNALNMINDPVFGKYAPVYYSSKDLMLEKYNNARDKEKFLKKIYLNPCTPGLL